MQNDHVFLSECSHEDWLIHQKRVIDLGFVPLVVRTELFIEVYNILLEMNARVWITGGTLLGAVREGDFIVDDDDVDMDMIEDEFVAIMYNIKDALVTAGYVVRLKMIETQKYRCINLGSNFQLGR